MKRLRRYARAMVDIFLFGSATLLLIVLAGAVVFSAYCGLYVMNHVDRMTDDVVRSTAKLEGFAAQLNAHAEFLTRKSGQIERKIDKYQRGGTQGKGG